VGSHAPFVSGGREDVKAARVWEMKLRGFEGDIGGCWLVVDWTMLLFVISRGCTIHKGGMGFCDGGFDDGRLKEL
jgi:hypothetical protein